jgi:hypothetical protein
MRADYDIECYAPDHYAFMPVVLLVMAGFTIALPATILFYLWRHRHNLYTTKTHQRMGWLYDSFVRGAEFWQVHDLLMKMVLTGMLIYIPPTSRAGIAILICVAAVANLNFFQPHKNKVLFWLSQISFVTTTAKYTVALLLSSSVDDDEQKLIGTMLIVLDIGFIVSSVLAILLSLWVLRIKVQSIHQQSREAKNNSMKITPSPTALTQGIKDDAADDGELNTLKNWGQEENTQ